MSSTPLLLEALRSMGKASSVQPAQQPLIPPVPPLANASPPPPQAWPPSTEAVKAMLAAAAAASAAAASAAGPAQPTASPPPASPPPFLDAAPQPNPALTAESHEAAAPGGTSGGRGVNCVADKDLPEERSLRPAEAMEVEPALPEALASVAAGNVPDSPMEQQGALVAPPRGASAEHPAQSSELSLPQPQLVPREQATAVSPGSASADPAFETASARAQTEGDAGQGAVGELTVQQAGGRQRSDELPAASSGLAQAAEGVSPGSAPADVAGSADVAAPVTHQAALVAPTDEGTAAFVPELSSILREAVSAQCADEQEMASGMDADDATAA